MTEVRRLGQYELLESLGAGGMGEVWRARHVLLDRPAAVKLVRPDASGASREQLLERFLREARATSALRSPHTVQLYDFGVTDDGALYYVMELLHGLDLRSMVEHHGPLQADRTIHMARAVCASLDEAHQRGLLHRDIKPANIFACRLGVVFDFPKVLDFGLVKAIADTGAQGIQLTATNAVLGTPAFMAPELATGSAEVDARADLYALGCVMYWLLTGRLVFRAENAMAMVMAHVAEMPTPPSDHTELPIPPALRDVVMQCLEKNPKDRFSSAVELSAALAEVPLETQWDQARAKRWWHTHLPGQSGDFPALGAADENQAWPAPSHDISLSLETSGPRGVDRPGPPADVDGGAGRRRWLLAAAATTAVLAVAIGGLGTLLGWFAPSPLADDRVPEITAASTGGEGETTEAPAVAPEEELAAARPVEPESAEPEPEAAPRVVATRTSEPEPAPPTPRPPPDPDPQPMTPAETDAVAVSEDPPEPEPARRFLADIEIGAVLPSGREAQGGSERRPYTCLPYTGPLRFDCRGYYDSSRGSWMPRSGTWLRRIATCEDRVVRIVELSKRWSPETSADQEDEIQASQHPGEDAVAAATAIAADFQEQGYARARTERGDDGRKRGGAWEVVTFRAGGTTATVRMQQEGEEYTVTVTATAPPSVCAE